VARPQNGVTSSQPNARQSSVIGALDVAVPQFSQCDNFTAKRSPVESLLHNATSMHESAENYGKIIFFSLFYITRIG